jgi:hypothetical protein
VALARGVLVQLVEQDDLQRQALAGPLLAGEHLVEQCSDDEPLGEVVQLVQVDDRDRLGHPVDPSAVRPNQLPDAVLGRPEAPHEGLARATLNPSGPRLVRLAVLGIDVLLDHLYQVCQGRHQPGAYPHDPFAPVDRFGKPLKLRPHPLLDEGQLVAKVPGLGEEEPQEPHLDELAGSPREGGYPLGTGVGVRQQADRAAGRRPE